ncbi:hypothetical protein Bbelb_240710 [Branchiostoma belcheri]|nr:hypothetical protein Bbelb_240710 [Branchiostoma belcheri]
MSDIPYIPTTGTALNLGHKQNRTTTVGNISETAAKCPVFKPPLNGFVYGRKSYGDVVNFTCEPGYKLVGKSSLTCLSDGTWNGILPTCTAVRCPSLSPPLNGFMTGSNSYGDVVNFTCESGYKLVGTSSLTCLSDGTWNGKSPTCTAVQCPILLPPLNGFMTGSNSFGDVVNFTCEPGYKLVGTSSLTCLSEGTWNGILPTCTDTAVQCPSLSPPLNGFMTGSNSYGDVVNFTCESGYKLVGTSSLTCQSNGTWNGKSPTCTAVQCPILSPPLNGFMTGSNSFGDVVNFTCEPGYKLVGTSSLTCLSDGTWNGKSPTCTLSVPDCAEGSWTGWFDRDDPWDTGDWETLTSLRRENTGQICSAPTAVHARVISTQAEASLAGEDIFSYDTTTGFICRKQDQDDNTCLDYEVRFCCPQTASACEDQALRLSCSNGRTLFIVDATYGRTTSSHSCRCGFLFQCRTNCRSDTSLAVVRAACQGKQRCAVAASNDVFGDPCLFVQKYLEVSYRCTTGQYKTSSENLLGTCRVPAGYRPKRPMPARLLNPTGASRGYIPNGHRRNWDLSLTRIHWAGCNNGMARHDDGD